MKFQVMASLALVGVLMTPARAADLDTRYGYGSGTASTTAPLSWTGFYVGANLGHGWGSAGWTSPTGFLGGVQAGYNWQFAGSPFMIGVVADYDWSAISAGPYSLNTLGLVRARAGFAFERILVYGTLGFAYGRSEFEVAGFSTSQSHTGWAIGAGLEYAFDRNWSARTEYVYVDLGDTTYSTIAGPVSMGFDASVLRAGVNYRF